MVALRSEGDGQPAEGRGGTRFRAPRRPARDTTPLPLVRRDTLPEETEYTDTGCDLAASCLRCPLPRCQYDEPGSVRTWLLAARDREIAFLRIRHRAPIDDLARTYGLTRRQIFRVLREQRDVMAAAAMPARQRTAGTKGGH